MAYTASQTTGAYEENKCNGVSDFSFDVFFVFRGNLIVFISRFIP